MQDDYNICVLLPRWFDLVKHGYGTQCAVELTIKGSKIETET